MSYLPGQTTNTTAYNRLYTTLTARLAGAGKQALELEISNAMQEFCRETQVWRERIHRNLVQDQVYYDLSPDQNNAAVTYIISIVADHRPLSALAGDSVVPRNPVSVYEVITPYSQIKIHPPSTRNVAKGLEAVIALAPRDGKLDVPAEIIDHHFESILDGVLERMYAHKNRPYSDSNLAAYHHRRFRASITRVRRIVRGGNAQSKPPWSFNNQAPGRPLRGGRSYGW